MPRNDKELSEVPSGKIKMGKTFFQNIRDRIETIRPEAGDSIKVEPNDGYGFKISCDFNVVTLNVCSNGVPSEIVVFTARTAT
jgi:hypothetical protein